MKGSGSDNSVVELLVAVVPLGVVLFLFGFQVLHHVVHHGDDLRCTTRVSSAKPRRLAFNFAPPCRAESGGALFAKSTLQREGSSHAGVRKGHRLGAELAGSCKNVKTPLRDKAKQDPTRAGPPC